jgi:Holliday junction resolvase
MSGSDYERELCRWFRAAGWHAQRAGSSGGGTTADLPDVTMGQDGHGFAVELKTTSDTYAYVDADEVVALERFADAFGMVPLLGARFKGDRTVYLFHPERTVRTEAGSYRLESDAPVRRVAAVREGDVPDPEWLLEAAHAARVASDMDSGE